MASGHDRHGACRAIPSGDRSVMVRNPFGQVWVFLTHEEDLSTVDIVARGRALVPEAPGS